MAPISIVLLLLLITVILFSIEKISYDLVTLGMLTLLVCTGILTPQQAFLGFGTDFMVMLASIFIISASLQNSGILDAFVEQIKLSEKRLKTPVLIALTMLISAFVSAFMNNTTVSALFIAPIISICKKLKISPSKLLMPMAFATLLGGTCTLIGTSTNVAASAYMSSKGLAPIGMFEMLPVGIIMVAIGILFMSTIGQKWLPNSLEESYTDKYDINSYLSEIIVRKNSSLLGKRVFDINLGDIKVLKLIRKQEHFFPDADMIVEQNDVLLVEGDKEQLMKMRKTKGIDILGGSLGDTDLESENIKLAELLVTPYSDLINNNLKAVGFRVRFGLSVLAIHRKNFNFTEKIGKVIIKTGDVLLVQGRRERFEKLKNYTDSFIIINELKEVEPKSVKKGGIVLLLFILAIIIGSLEIIPVSVAFLAVGLLCIAIKAIDSENAYNAIEWRLLILIGGMTAFGKAMQITGADKYIATLMVNQLQQYGTLSLLAGFMILTVVLTQPMSNAAAALVVLPVALQTAELINANPRIFAIGVTIAASISMITPFEPACILVITPGQYRIRHFLLIGGLLTFLVLIAAIILIPYYWTT